MGFQKTSTFGFGYSPITRHISSPKFPPSRRAFSSSFGSTGSAMAVIWGIIGANTIIFGAWQYVIPSGPMRIQTMDKTQRDLAQSLEKNFITSTQAVKAGRWWTAVTSAFSHYSLTHFLGNMVSLYAFASILSQHPAITPARMAILTFGSAISGSMGFYMHNMNTYRSQGALGASGIVMGVGAAAATIFPRASIYLYGIVPVPLWLLIGGYFFVDSYYLDRPGSTTAHAGHLGGLAFGTLFALARLKRGRF